MSLLEQVIVDFNLLVSLTDTVTIIIIIRNFFNVAVITSTISQTTITESTEQVNV